MRRTFATTIAAVAAITVLAACDDDRGARKDLPNSQQEFDEDTANVILMPDRFPGMVWRCFGDDDTTGYYTTTDRGVWIVYNDPNCGALEGPITVLDNVPGAVG